MKRLAYAYALGCLTGAAWLYCAGPAIGLRLQRSGDRLAAMSGATQLHSAAEIEATVDAMAQASVMRHARQIVEPMTARVGGRR